MAKITVAPKGARSKILLPPRVKPDPAHIGLQVRHPPPTAGGKSWRGCWSRAQAMTVRRWCIVVAALCGLLSLSRSVHAEGA